MSSKRDATETEHAEAGASSSGDEQTTTRRRFLRQAARKAVFVTPVILTLSGSQAQAASGEFDSTCADAGSPCVVNGDCCATLVCLPSMTCGNL